MTKVDNALLADMVASRLKGRITTTGSPQDLTAAQVQTMLGFGAISAPDALFTVSTDIAATATTDMNTATGVSVTVTGTAVSITSFGSGVNPGRLRIVTFTGGLTLVHSGNLILPGSADKLTSSGDVGVFISNGTTSWRCVSYASRVVLSPVSDFRNQIINGGFDICQRAFTQSASGYGSDDRWSNDNSGTTKVHTQQVFALGQTDVPGNPTWLSRTVVTSVAGTGNYCYKMQKIEGVNTLAGKTVTVTFYAKADAAKNISVELIQSFGVGGSPSSLVSIPAVSKTMLSTTFARYSITFAVPSISGKVLGTTRDYLGLIFWFDAGSSLNSRTNSLGQQSGTFELARVSLVEGDATGEPDPFTPRHIGQELALCQRYYEADRYSVFSGRVFTGANYYMHVRYAVPKRALPTVVTTAVSASGFANVASNIGSGASSTEGTEFYRAATSTVDGGYFYDHWSADAEI